MQLRKIGFYDLDCQNVYFMEMILSMYNLFGSGNLVLFNLCVFKGEYKISSLIFTFKFKVHAIAQEQQIDELF